ncbi:Amine oxidase [flavin-containing] [Triplophysa tibetana]|uniref:Amine oxidase n=1 Tax=Triplophysa tibetana TaxID=1572043 RepID=A0A5A9N3X7_9TELE|nr:Amine oxidase [flavin-containing] [Triplophysa tibetana]
MCAEESCDIVVVGAGLSGLSAARDLQRRNKQLNVLVLEAKDRVGGRTLGENLPAADGMDLWDMGGQWVASSQTHVMELIKELGLEVYPQFSEGKKVHHMGGPHAKIKTYTSSIPSYSPLVMLDLVQFLWRIDRLTRTVSVEDPMSSPKAQLYDSMTLQSYMEQHVWTAELKEEMALCSRAVFGMEPSQMSFLYFLMYSNAAGGALKLMEATPGSAQEFRVKGGTQQLSEKLAEQIGKERVRLGSAVMTICQNAEKIEVKTSVSTITCQAVIVTCPPHMAAQIHYEPPLPAERQRLAQCAPVGHMLKFIITYPTAFWRNKGFSGEIVTRPSEDCPLSVTFDATSPRGNPALVGFIAGVQARDWCGKEMKERRAAVISSLVKYLGPEASTYIHYQEKDWAKEEYSGGCPVNVMAPGMLTYYHPSLRKPFGRIHWAGTETATQWCGYLSGAIQSGQRASVEVLFQISPSSLSQEELLAARASQISRDLKKNSECGSSTSCRILAVVMTAATLLTAYLLARPQLGLKWI